MVEAVDNIEHRRLAGAVGTDDRPHFALDDIEADILDRPHTAEGQGDVVDIEQDFARCPPQRSFGRLLDDSGRVDFHVADFDIAFDGALAAVFEGHLGADELLRDRRIV